MPRPGEADPPRLLEEETQAALAWARTPDGRAYLCRELAKFKSPPPEYRHALRASVALMGWRDRVRQRREGAS